MGSRNRDDLGHVTGCTGQHHCLAPEIITIAFGDFDLTPQGTGIRDKLHLTVHSWLVINICSGRSMSGTHNATPD
jgi:hypothetical protein